MKLSKLFKISMILVLSISLLTACSSSSSDTTSEEVDYSDTVVTLAMGSAWKDLVPYNGGSGGYYSGLVLGLLYDRLTYVDGAGNITERAAKDWEISEDGLTATFYLNDAAVWSDGEPVTAEDYVFAAELITDPMNVVDQKSYYSIITGTDTSGNADGTTLGVEAIDDYTLVYTFDSPINEAVTFPSYINYYLALPKHELEGTDPSTYASLEYWNNPLTNGPLLFESQIAGSEIVMAANPDYYLGVAEFGKFKITVMAVSNMASAMIAGDVDMAYPALSSDDISSFEAVDHLTIFYPETPDQPYMLFVNQAVYSDVRIRQAIDLAIDREAVANMLGRAAPIEGPIPANSAYFNEIMVPTFDQETAAALIAEAAADGAIDLSETITFSTPPGAREKCATIIAQNLVDIGLPVEVQVTEAATMFAGFYDGSTSIGLVNMNFQTNPMYLRNLLTNDAATLINTADDTWDDYYDAFMAATSDEERTQIMMDYQQTWLEEPPFIEYVATFNDYAYTSYLGDSIGMEDIPLGNFAVWEWKLGE